MCKKCDICGKDAVVKIVCRTYNDIFAYACMEHNSKVSNMVEDMEIMRKLEERKESAKEKGYTLDDVRKLIAKRKEDKNKNEVLDSTK